MSGIGKTGPLGRRDIDGDQPDAGAAASQAAGMPAQRGGRPRSTESVVTGDLLRQSLETRMPAGQGRSRASSLPSGRDVLYAAPLLAAERRGDPAAYDRFLSGGAHDQRALLNDVRSVARTFNIAADRGGSAYAGSAGGRATAQASGRARLDADGFNAHGSARAQVGFSGTTGGQFESALVNANVRLHAEAMAYAQAQGQMHVDRNGLRAVGEAEIGLRAKVEFDASFRTAGVTIGGQRLDLNGQLHREIEVSAYARVDADVAATMQPPRLVAVANAKAFAGVKASANASIGIGDFVKVSAEAQAWAGAGAEAGVKVGYDNGKLRLGFNAGAAVGVGAGLSFAIEIDLRGIAKFLGLSGGEKINIDIFLQGAAGAGFQIPPQLVGLEVLFPPELSESFRADAMKQDDRLRARAKERDAAERHVRAYAKQSAGVSVRRS